MLPSTHYLDGLNLGMEERLGLVLLLHVHLLLLQELDGPEVHWLDVLSVTDRQRLPWGRELSLLS